MFGSSLFYLAINFASLGSATPPYFYEISGTVYDSKSHVPVPEASVVVRDSSGVALETTAADQIGDYTVGFFTAVLNPTVSIIANAPGFFQRTSVGKVNTVSRDFYLTPRLICARSAVSYADVDCMSQRDVSHLLRSYGFPVGEYSSAEELERMSSAYGANGSSSFLVLSAQGEPSAVARPILLAAAGSLSAAGADALPFSVYRYKATVTGVSTPSLQEAVGATGNSVSLECPGGGIWESRTYYGERDNTWCSYRTSEEGCKGCCGDKMAVCTGASVTVGAALATTGPWGIVAGAVIIGAGGYVCYRLEKKCEAGCTCRFPACVDQRGNYILESYMVPAVDAATRQWQELTEITGKAFYSECGDKYELRGTYNGYAVGTLVDGADAVLGKIRGWSGSTFRVRGLLDPHSGKYVINAIRAQLTYYSPPPWVTVMCGAAP